MKRYMRKTTARSMYCESVARNGGYKNLLIVTKFPGVNAKESHALMLSRVGVKIAGSEIATKEYYSALADDAPYTVSCSIGGTKIYPWMIFGPNGRLVVAFLQMIGELSVSDMVKINRRRARENAPIICRRLDGEATSHSANTKNSRIGDLHNVEKNIIRVLQNMNWQSAHHVLSTANAMARFDSEGADVQEQMKNIADMYFPYENIVSLDELRNRGIDLGLQYSIEFPAK